MRSALRRGATQQHHPALPWNTLVIREQLLRCCHLPQPAPLEGHPWLSPLLQQAFHAPLYEGISTGQHHAPHLLGHLCRGVSTVSRPALAI